MNERERNRLITEAESHIAAATPGSWVARDANNPARGFYGSVRSANGEHITGAVALEDAEFIAWAQNNVPLLVSELLHNSHTCAEFEAVEVENAGLRDTIARVRQVATDASIQSDEGILIIDPSRITDIIDEGPQDE